MWVPDERRLWTLDRRDEFKKTWAKAQEALTRPEAHMAAIEKALARNPLGVSYPSVDERQRIVRTIDRLDGWEIRVFFRIHEPERRCELGWVQLKPLEAD